ncbi:Vacuolar ATP synthase subunit C [Tulasnella sp. 424]|nr:Vacuolar ATP synthase subunit C [Tulasnella sp. 424]
MARAPSDQYYAWGSRTRNGELDGAARRRTSLNIRSVNGGKKSGKGVEVQSSEWNQRCASIYRGTLFSQYAIVGDFDQFVFDLQDSTRFHVIDAQSFENHCVVTVPKASSGSDAPSSSRRNFNQIWPSLSTTHRYDSDEDMENAEEVPMSRPAQQPSASSSWPSRGPALSALPDGTPNLAGLAFDPTGGSLYVGSDTGIFEWELDSESRKWDRGYCLFIMQAFGTDFWETLQGFFFINIVKTTPALNYASPSLIFKYVPVENAFGTGDSLVAKLLQAKAVPRENVASLEVPGLKTGTLDLLITLSEELPKHDHSFTQITAKIVETLRNLLSNDPARLSQHTRVDERTVDEYLLGGWRWNTGKYPINRGLRELVDGLVKEMNSIDNVMKAKLNAYNLAKGSLVQMQRKKTGNLAVRSLAEIVSKEDFIPESEYMESLMVAVPKNSVKDWESKYERLAKIAEDDDYALFCVVVFKKVHDEFAQKLRENKATEDFAVAETTERELWTELLRISRTNFSEAFQVLVHLKVARLFVESVLRYGLPAQYIGIVVKPDAKYPKKALQVLTEHFKYLANRSNSSKTKTATPAGGEELAAEYQSLMEQEFLDFVVFEVPWIV